MAQATEIRKGTVIIYNGELYEVLEFQHVTPGKGHAMVQTTIRNMKTGKSMNNRFRSNEDVEVAWLDKAKMQFLYSDQDGCHFMNLESYETIEISFEALGDGTKYLLENMEIDVMFHKGDPVKIDLPTTVTLKVIETEPGDRGNTVTNLKKPAKLETGYELSVPLFIEIDESIVVDTRTGEYVSRA